MDNKMHSFKLQSSMAGWMGGEFHGYVYMFG